MCHIIAILRRPDGLHALALARSAPFEPPSGYASGDTYVPEYVESLHPVTSLPKGVYADAPAVQQAFDALASVAEPDATTLLHVLTVLAHTVMDPSAEAADPPPVSTPTAPPRRRPTAAHPRGYRGTKYQPPKIALRSPVDLRPHLASPRHEAVLLTELAVQFDAALATSDPESSLGRQLRHAGRDVLRPHGAAWSPPVAARIANLPAAFRRYFTWMLRGADWATITTALAAYWALDLEHDAELRRIIAVLLHHSPTAQQAKWCTAVARIQQHRRRIFADLLIETAAYRRVPSPETIADLVRTDELCLDNVFPHRMHFVLTTLYGGRPLAGVLEGIELANDDADANSAGHPSQSFCVSPTSTGLLAPIRDAVRRFRASPHSLASPVLYPQLHHLLWERCARLPGLARILRDLPWARLDASDLFGLVMAVTDLVHEELDDESRLRKWSFLCAQFEQLVELVAATPDEYRMSAVDHLREFIFRWDEPDELAEKLPLIERAMRRCCRSGFEPVGKIQEAVVAFTALAPARFNDIATAPDTSWRALDRATRRTNKTNLLRRGLWTLIYEYPDATVAGFVSAASALLRTAAILGSIAEPLRVRILQSQQVTSLFAMNPAMLSPATLGTIIEHRIANGITNPIPRRLRDHLQGRRMLTETQIERDRGLIIHRWPAFLWQVLAHHALSRLNTGIGADQTDPAVRHALLLLPDAGPNRRGLRRLLHACAQGSRQSPNHHPANQAWLARHPTVAPDVWLVGLRAHHRGADGTAVILAIETDVFEVLRLGTYVGSCLGVGGTMSLSAAAVALDVNKQVVYARDARGHVIARQLLAISESDHLVCYEIYPQGMNADVIAWFREYDQQFAKVLGLPIQRDTESAEEADEVAAILARYYWDDGAWDHAAKT